MRSKTMGPLAKWDRSVFIAIGIGAALVAVTFVVAFAVRVGAVTSLAGDVTTTLQQQCESYEKLMATDRTKSLFRLSGIMKQLSASIADHPENIDDAYLEGQVNNLRLTGISLLDGNLNLEASGYTRQFRDTEWTRTSFGAVAADIIQYPSKVFAERLEVDGTYYDVCAVAREDAPGILIGYYEQPTGLIASTEDDLESLLSGLQLEDGGNYAIAENGHVRASSNKDMRDCDVADDSLLSAISELPNDSKLHSLHAGEGFAWGYHSAAANYDLYVYYPTAAIYVSALIAVGVVAGIYLVLSFAFFALRARALYANQERLEQANESLTQTVEMLKSLETIYFTLFRVDLEQNAYRTIYLAPWLEGAVPREGAYTQLKDLLLGSMTLPEFRSVVDEKMSIAHIKESLSKQNTSDVRKSFYVDYIALREGQRRWCRVSVTVVDYDAAGTPAHVLALLQDVDREKKREAEYQARILEEAREAKIANNAKSEFLRRISHDVRTPINGAKGYIQLAAAHPEDSELRQQCGRKALVALDTLMSLVDSVLDMAKLEGREVALERRHLDLNDLLNRVETVVEPQAAAKHVELDIRRASDDACNRLVGSPRHVGQVLMNLVVNGVKYARPGGHVQLSARLANVSGGKATYEFTCVDDGIGMSKEFQRHMFEPFSQEAQSARTTYEGSGMGLAIVQKLVEAMGGSIACESRKGQGTTFCVTLTFELVDAAHAGADAAACADNPLQGASVLLVEDNDMNREIAEILLVDLGANVTCAKDGQEAVDLFAASAPATFDIVLTDIMMPVKDGLEMAREIRSMNRPDAATVPICAMSANAFPDDVQASLDAGINAHIAKPIDVEKVLPTLADLMGFRR